MSTFDLQRMLLDQLPLSFLFEVMVRVLIAFLAVFIFLKSSGRRGIRQLSLFELLVILILGSAAGDMTFYEDVPLLPVVMVFLTLLLLYRLTVLLMAHSKTLDAWIEGVPITVIHNGLYELATLGKTNITSREFLMELRQQGIEHLGQARLVIMETDGDLSVFFQDQANVRPGLSVLPSEHRPTFKTIPAAGLYCCINCGQPEQLDSPQEKTCPRCGKHIWSPALNTQRSR